jgi:hypothetical protein
MNLHKSPGSFSILLAIRFARKATFLFLVILPAPGGLAQMKKPPAQTCDAHLMMRFTYENNLDRALAEAETCLAAAEKQAAANEPNRGRECGLFHGNPDPFCGMMDIPSIAHYLCVKVQLLAMIRSPNDASRAFDQLEELGNYHPELHGNFLSAPGWIMDYQIAKGMLLESEGRPDEAKLAYRRCSKPDAFDVGLCFGRLASLALRQKDDDDALIWSRAGSVYHDPGALAIFAALKEKQGSDTEAFLYYYESEELMKKEIEPTGFHTFMPVAVLEQSRVVAGLARVGSSAPKVIESDGKQRVLDASGQLAGWERWPHAFYSDKVKEEQDDYNRYLRGANLPSGVSTGPQYPRFFLGFTSEERDTLAQQGFSLSSKNSYSIPDWIEPTGILDRDTLAIPFYEGVVQFMQLATDAGVSLQQVEAPLPKGFSSTSNLEVELKRADASLSELHDFLARVKMNTSRGVSLDAWTEARQFVAWKESSQSINFDAPPDFVTAHLDGSDLTPTFRAQLESFENAVKEHLDAARLLMPPKPASGSSVPHQISRSVSGSGAVGLRFPELSTLTWRPFQFIGPQRAESVARTFSPVSPNSASRSRPHQAASVLL